MNLNADIANTSTCADEEEFSSSERLEVNLNNSQSENNPEYNQPTKKERNKSEKQKQRERQHRKRIRNAKRKAKALEKLEESQSTFQVVTCTDIRENEGSDPQEESQTDGNKQDVPILDNNTAHSDDIFGILSIYIERLKAAFTVRFIRVSGSQKKGISAWAPQLLCDDFKVLNNMSWWYDWTIDLSSYNTHVANVCPGNTVAPEYVPMVWTYNTRRSHLNISRSARFILGFNEPDHADQANLTPQQAADAWPEIEKHSHGLPLVSPSTAGENYHWFDEFLRLCKGCRIDYVAAHMYSCNAHQVMSYLQKLFHRYHKKIWLTEFGCPYAATEEQQLHLMKTLLPQLEQADFVFRYSWFMARIKRSVANGFVSPAESLLLNNTSTMTNIGRFYNNFQSHSSSHIVG